MQERSIDYLEGIIFNMKLLYNITTRVDHSVVDEWKTYMTTYFIPAMMSTDCFDSYKMMRILGDPEEDGETFAVQYVAHNLNAFVTYQENHMPKLQSQTREMFQDKALSFKTLMEIDQES